MSETNPVPHDGNEKESPNGPSGSVRKKEGQGRADDNGDSGSNIIIMAPARDDALDRHCAKMPMTDLGNAERFAARYGRDYRFCPEIGWFQWDGMRWELLSEESGVMPAPIMQRVFGTIRAIRNEALLVRDSGVKRPEEEHWDAAQIQAHRAQQERHLDWVVQQKGNKVILYSDKLIEWARSSEASARINAIAPLVKNFAAISARVDEFDVDRKAINCMNGTLRLGYYPQKRSAAERAKGKSEFHSVWGVKLYEHKREDLITKVAKAQYKPKARSPIYDEFMSVVQPDAVMRRFLLQWAGLSFTGDISEQKLAFFYGQGRNGKGTWVETMAHIAGDYAGNIGVDSLMDNGKRQGNQASPDIAKLPGTRFLRASEPSKGQVLNEGLIKMVTGGDPVDARHLNKGFFTFIPSFKITISGNNKPTIKDTSDGIWRRVQLVPWDVQIAKDKVDKQLVDKLQAEANGIFARVIEGLVDWRREGLMEPEAVRLATQDYRDDSDDLGRFLRQCCKIGEDRRDRPWRSPFSDMHALYEAWAIKTGAYEYSAKQLGKAMRDKGFKSIRSNGVFWVGVRAMIDKEDIDNGSWTALDEQSGTAPPDAAHHLSTPDNDEEVPDWMK